MFKQLEECVGKPSFDSKKGILCMWASTLQNEIYFFTDIVHHKSYFLRAYHIFRKLEECQKVVWCMGDFSDGIHHKL